MVILCKCVSHVGFTFLFIRNICPFLQRKQRMEKMLAMKSPSCSSVMWSVYCIASISWAVNFQTSSQPSWMQRNWKTLKSGNHLEAGVTVFLENVNYYCLDAKEAQFRLAEDLLWAFYLEGKNWDYYLPLLMLLFYGTMWNLLTDCF